MKKAIKQSKLIFLLNAATGALMIIVLVMYIMMVNQSKTSDQVNENRFNLTDGATRFMNASSYLTGEGVLLLQTVICSTIITIIRSWK